ncbi:MAG: GntR family transcriptional regulator, partial [Gammaproteobacteria bacterium]|nr:GntR family transcriptional regulator [Gammaproteobacteria bacterium]
MDISTTMEIPTHKRSSESGELATSKLIQEDIETAIIRGDFSPGEHLDESRLAKRYGV